MDNNIILSICIPTYNRAESLSKSLEAAIIASKDFDNEVEIIVSNNCSTDATLNVLENLNSIPNFKYFTNESNIGFNYNYFKLVDIYSSGIFCWVIGDDDFLHKDSVGQVLEIIHKYPDIEFIYANYKLKDYKTILKELESFSDSDPFTFDGIRICEYCSFNQILDKSTSSTNILLSFISASIFKRVNINGFDKKIFSNNSHSSFYNLFPHSYMFANLFINKNAVFIENKVITVAVQSKNWDYVLPLIYMKYLPELYEYYRSSGVSKYEMKKTNVAIAYNGILNLFILKTKSQNVLEAKISFLRKYLFNRGFYIAVSILASKAIKRTLMIK